MMKQSSIVDFVIDLLGSVSNVSVISGYDSDWKAPNKIGLYVVNPKTNAGNPIIFSNGWKQKIEDTIAIRIVSTGNAVENVWQVRRDIMQLVPGNHPNDGGVFRYGGGIIQEFSPERIVIDDNYFHEWWLTKNA